MLESMGTEIIMLRKLDLFLQRINKEFEQTLTKDNLKYFLLSKGITIMSIDTKLHLKEGDTCIRFIDNQLVLQSKINNRTETMYI